jgi:hypothetical protein
MFFLMLNLFFTDIKYDYLSYLKVADSTVLLCHLFLKKVPIFLPNQLSVKC